MTLSVIIVSYNTREMTLRCLETLTTHLDGHSAEIFVVDNASTDGSAAAVRERFSEAKVIEMEQNLGFGAANNVAMRQATGKYFLLLNSDAFPHAGAVGHLVTYLDAHPQVGVVGPRLVFEDGSMQLSCFRFPTPARAWLENLWISAAFHRHPRLGDYRHWAHDEEREVDFAIGACLLLRREVFTQVGGFDERFFMYQEEADWQRRIQAAGWKVAFTPGAVVTHLAGGSGKAEPARISHYFFDSLDRYALIHHGRPGFWLTRAAMLLGCSLRAILWGVLSVLPSRRERARLKMRKHVRLVERQLLTRAPILSAP